MTENSKWYRQPQGWVAAITITTAVLGFFYVREKQMWETSTRISAVEARGTNAIAQANARFDAVNARFERLEQVISDMRGQINFMERKIDRIEILLKETMERQGRSYDPTER